MKQVQEPKNQEQSQIKTCATCEHFTTLNVSRRAAAHGLYRCTGYLATIEVCVSWDQARCGGYRPAKNQAQRESWIAKQSAMAQGSPE